MYCCDCVRCDPFGNLSLPRSLEEMSASSSSSLEIETDESASSPPTDAELSVAVTNLLRETWDLNTITLNTIKATMEGQFKCQLTERKAIIKHALSRFMEDQQEALDMEQNAGDDEGEYEGENETKTEEEDEEEEGGRGKTKRKRGAPSGAGFNKSMQLSTELSEFLGAVTMSRPQIVKALWAYIKENSLQNPADKREILCDAKLEHIFKRKKVHMFTMNKYLSTMIKSVTDLQDGPGNEDDDEDEDDDSEDEEEDKDARPKKKADKKAAPKKSGKCTQEKRVKKQSKDKPKVKKEAKEGGGGGGGGFNKVHRISPELSKLLGVDEASRPQIVKGLWAYIKENNLQNPADRREILCDKAMKAVFNMDMFTSFGMNKYIGAHLLP